MRLSVVIPCRNEEATLPRQLAALVAQEYLEQWEIVVADNGSTDRTGEVARAFATGSVPLTVADASDRPGRHHACNAGVRSARGELLLFVDADDEVAPGYVAAMASALEDFAVVGARIDHQALSTGWVGHSASEAQTEDLQDPHGFLPVASGGAMGIRRDVFQELGGFREPFRYAEDVDLCWRAQLSGHRIGFAPRAVLRYQYRADHRAMYRQHRGFGRGAALLYRHYAAAGMRRRSGREAVREWLRLVAGLPRIADPATRARWVRRLARDVGRLQGSVRYRVFFP